MSIKARLSYAAPRRVAAVALSLGIGVFATAARADDDPVVRLTDSGRLLATSGVSQIEGAGGGGLVPWAVITGYGTQDAIGANVHATYVGTGHYSLYSPGIAVGLFNRVELSYASDIFDTGSTGKQLGLGNGFIFRTDVFGVKVKAFGDIVYDQDTLLPQVAFGAQYKRNQDPTLLHALGARSAEGVDFYAAATKLFLAQSLLVNATIRLTRANQFGLLGFGGNRDNGYEPEFEGSAAFLLSKHLAVGAEYRTKPSNLKFAKEDNAYDVFAAYFITKNVSATLAYVDLGSIATFREQRGVYASLQVGF